MDAACKGAQFGLQLIGAIIANIVAFVAFVAFLNSIISWLGHLIGFEDLSFEVSTCFKRKTELDALIIMDLKFLYFFTVYTRENIDSGNFDVGC